MKKVWWAVAIFVAWLLIDPKGLAGTVTTFFHALGTLHNSFGH